MRGRCTSPTSSVTPRAPSARRNVEGTRNLLAAAVRAGHDRFVFTSTTSLMISDADPRGESRRGDGGGLARRGFRPACARATFTASPSWRRSGLCRHVHAESGLAIAILRTGRFFPEEDDTHRALSGPNIKANEFLNRRLTVEDAAEAHLVALEKAPALGFETFVLSAPPPFAREDCAELLHDAPAVIARLFPDAPGLYARMGWSLPASLDRVYDPSRAERLMGFRCRTDFRAVLDAIATGGELPFAHDPAYVSPKERQGDRGC